MDKNFNIDSINKTFIELTGYELKDIRSVKFLNLINDDDKSVTESVLLKLRQEKDNAEVSSRLMKKDKSNLWLSWRFYFSNNQIYALAVDKTNDQEIKNSLIKQNRQVEQERARINAMLSNIGDAVVGTTDKGEIYYMNKSAEEMLDIKLLDVMNKLFLQEVVVVDDKDQDIDSNKHPIRNAMMTRRTVYSRDYYLLRKDKTKFAASITASPVMLRDNLIGGVVIFRDITKEREIDRMKTEFISLASHQLRTPLSAMKWFSEMLLDGDIGQLTDKQKDVILKISNSNQRMIELVNSLLNISRIESGRMVVEPEPTNLKNLVDEVLLELQPKIEEKKHHLAVSVHGDLPMVNIDPKLVRHIYINLLTNAIKYTNEGGEIVVLISKSEDSIVSQISDNGLGVPKAQQERLFEKFFRAENIARIVTDGTGLGLYLVKAIVEASGGKIWFESEENKGTTFWFSLPLTGSKAVDGEVSIDS